MFLFFGGGETLKAYTREEVESIKNYNEYLKHLKTYKNINRFNKREVKEMKRQKHDILKLGEDFKYKNIDFLYYNTYLKDIYQCYNRPSQTKINIYNYYYDLLKNNSDYVYNYGIVNYNGFIITLGARIEKDGKDYLLYITPSYNYYMELSKAI